MIASWRGALHRSGHAGVDRRHGGHFLATQPLAALVVQPWQVYALGRDGVFCTVLPVFAQSAAIRRIGSGRRRWWACSPILTSCSPGCCSMRVFDGADDCVALVIAASRP